MRRCVELCLGSGSAWQGDEGLVVTGGRNDGNCVPDIGAEQFAIHV